LRGQLWDIGGYYVWFEWRESGAGTWNSTSAQYEPTTALFYADLSSLDPETEYEFRALAVYDLAQHPTATHYGSTLTFTTTAA
jgi:hypothetical protein